MKTENLGHDVVDFIEERIGNIKNLDFDDSVNIITEIGNVFCSVLVQLYETAPSIEGVSSLLDTFKLNTIRECMQVDYKKETDNV